MTYLNTRVPPHGQVYIALSSKQIYTLFTSALALLCQMQIAVSAQNQFKLLGHSTTPIVAARFTPSGGVIAASKNGTVSLWGSDTDHPIWHLSLGRAPRKNDYTQIKISAMDLSTDGRIAVAAYLRFGVDRNLIDEKAGNTTRQKDGVWETHVVLIDATDGTIKKDIEGLGDTSVTSVVLASSGKYVFVTTANSLARAILNHQSPASTTYVLSIDTGQVLRSFRSKGWIASATLSPDDRCFAAAAHQSVEGSTSFYEIQLYDADTGRLLRSSEFETTHAAAISNFLDDGLLAVSRSGRDGLQVDLVPRDGSEKVTHLVRTVRSAESRAVALIPEQQRIVLAGGTLRLTSFDDIGTPRFNDQGGVVFIIDQRTGETLRTSPLASFVTCLAVSRDGLKIAAGMYDGRIAIIPALN